MREAEDMGLLVGSVERHDTTALLARVAVAADQTIGEAQPGIMRTVTGRAIVGHGFTLTTLTAFITLSYDGSRSVSVNIV